MWPSLAVPVLGFMLDIFLVQGILCLMQGQMRKDTYYSLTILILVSLLNTLIYWIVTLPGGIETYFSKFFSCFTYILGGGGQNWVVASGAFENQFDFSSVFLNDLFIFLADLCSLFRMELLKAQSRENSIISPMCPSPSFKYYQSFGNSLKL